MKGLVELYGISGKKWLKPTFFVHNFQTIHWIFYETWPNVSKYVFLYFDIGLHAWKILVFELNPFKQ